MAETKRMGSLGKLSQFSGIKATPPEAKVEPPVEPIETEPVVAEPEPTPEPEPQPEPAPSKPKSRTKKRKDEEKLVAINIKITKGQRNWLSDAAELVRENNDEPVPPLERVYPQHLIGVAIDLLKTAEVEWDEIKTVEELRKHLNL